MASMQPLPPELDRLARTMGRVAGAADDSVAFRGSALPILARELGFDFGVMSTNDPATVTWTSCVLHGIASDPGRHQALFRNEYASDDVNRISDLARGPIAATLSGLPAELRGRSERAGFLAAGGVTDELRVALCADGACWGTLVGYRTGGTFSPAEVASAVALAPSLAEALRLSMLKRASTGGDHAPGVLVLAPNGSIRPLGPTADRWADELRDHSGHLPVLTALAARLDPTPSVLVQGRSGSWIRVHLVPGEGDDRLAIVEPARTIELAWTLAMAYGLTPRERTVVMGVAQGLAAKEIAAVLEISPWTVHDHVKAALAKVGVDSRQALVARLFHDHVLPRREAGLHPGPWGWFDEGRPQ